MKNIQEASKLARHMYRALQSECGYNKKEARATVLRSLTPEFSGARRASAGMTG